VLVHCFDGHAQNSWLAPADCADIEHGSCLVSASMIFSLQNRDLHDNPTGREASDSLFACPGGIVFRPGVTIVQCGAPGDCGGYCHQPCPSLDDDAERTGPSSNPDSCTWAVDDIGIYLERETNERRAGKYRNNGYNEFLVRGDRWMESLATNPSLGAVEAFVTTASAGFGAHAGFLRTYGLTADEVPLLKLGPDPDQPFIEANAHGRCEEWCNQWTCTAEQCTGCERCTKTVAHPTA